MLGVIPQQREHVDLAAQRGFSPYADNGGSVVAVSGEDFAILAADTRLSQSGSYLVMTRSQDRLVRLTPCSVLATAGCWCDALTLQRLVGARLTHYRHEHRKPMPTTAAAQMLSTMLYHKRFFPYYVSPVLAGLDADGRGCVFSYDPVGNFERSSFRAAGSAGALLQPLLDNQLEFKNAASIRRTVSCDEALAIVKDSFISAAERDIYTGDSICINIITKDGVRVESFDLRRD